MKKLTLTICCILLLLLTSCSTRDTQTEHNGYDWLPSANSENEILLYFKYDQHILSYDKNTHEVVEVNDTDNYFQYEFNNLATNIYTAGHSAENNFKIVRMNEKNTELLYQMEQNEAIFPLAYQDEENMYFFKCTYDKNKGELYDQRVICKFNAKTKQLEELDVTRGLQTNSGAIINDLLYFTTYNDIDEDSYRFELYKMDINTEAKVELVNDNLAESEIYNHNGKLWVSDKDYIYDYEDNTNKLPKQYSNYFYNNTLFQIDVNKNADLELTVTDTTTKEVIKTYDQIIDFIVKDNNVTVYTYDETESFALGE